MLRTTRFAAAGPGARVLTAIATIALCAAVASPAIADSTSLEDRVRQLEDLVREQGKLLEKQNQRIEEQQRELDARDGQAAGAAGAGAVGAGTAAASAPAQTAAATPEKKYEVKTGYDGLRISSTDGKFKFGVGGRMQLDFNAFNEDVTDLGSGVEIRRARLKAYGTMYKVFDYKFEVNFDMGGSASITDAWLRYSGRKPVVATVGHQKVPFSQQSMTSSNWQVFQERAMMDAFIDNGETGRRRLGGVVGGYGKYWNFYGGFFGEGLDTSGTSNENWGSAGRLVGIPIYDKQENGSLKVVALGASTYYRTLSSASELRFRARPEAHIAGTRMVDTEELDGADDLLMYNFEASTVWGPFHAQGEYTGVDVGRDAGQPGIGFGGWYLQGGYFITGESRNYDKKTGKYKRIMPRSSVGEGGKGAWEVAARFSDMDLTDKDVLGGRERNVTAALNWWATPSVLFRLNYVHAWLDPNSTETLDGVDEEVDVFEGRAQIVF